MTMLNPSIKSVDSVDVEAQDEVKSAPIEEWAPSRKELFIMVSLAFISFVVALDATILVTVLPVSGTFPNGQPTRS